MSSYVKPTIEVKPDNVNLHIRANDLRLNNESNKIGNYIENVALSNHYYVEINSTLKLKT